MKTFTLMRRSLLAMCAAASLAGLPVQAQDVQERVIKFGHLNNADHPVSMGTKKFAELVAAKSGGKLKVQEFRPRRWATRCSSSPRCRAVCRR